MNNDPAEVYIFRRIDSRKDEFLMVWYEINDYDNWTGLIETGHKYPSILPSEYLSEKMKGIFEPAESMYPIRAQSRCADCKAMILYEIDYLCVRCRQLAYEGDDN